MIETMSLILSPVTYISYVGLGDVSTTLYLFVIITFNR